MTKPIKSSDFYNIVTPGLNKIFADIFDEEGYKPDTVGRIIAIQKQRIEDLEAELAKLKVQE